MNTETQNQYLLLFRGTDWHKGLSPEEVQNVMTQWKAWFDRLSEQGKLKAGQPLEREGKTVSGKKGRVVADGPFAESKEAVGGFFIVNATSLDEAVGIARTSPAFNHGARLEVRQIANLDCD